jgi:hypothetical protein
MLLIAPVLPRVNEVVAYNYDWWFLGEILGNSDEDTNYVPKKKKMPDSDFDLLQ